MILPLETLWERAKAWGREHGEAITPYHVGHTPL